ncbi:MAG: outer membrane protein assembly factor BamA [Noviherbaspirillum sp.]
MKFYPERFPFLPVPCLVATAFALVASHALAIEPFVVRDIRVEGIQRTEAGTVFGYLPVKVGDTFNDEKAAQAIKALYATGFFKDVRIEAEGDVLVVTVEERPSIAGVEFTDTKEFDKDQLTKALKDIGLGESRIFDRALADRAEQELKRQYLSRGLYGVQITTTVTPIERNRVVISFAVDEGEVARIRQINIVGNKAYSDKELRDLIKLSTPGWFTWYTKSDQYSREKLAGDLETLRSFYLNRGYLEMQVESTQVSITPDRKDIYVTININEGDKFTVSDIRLEGEMLGREEELRSLLELKKGDVYSGQKLAESTRRISDRMGDFGYAFANVNANPQINREKKEVAFTVLIDPGKRVYVRRINVTGNTRTRDEVIRREFRQFESSWYDGEKIKLSRDRVDRLGYFTEVNIETPEVPGTTDQVDLNVGIVEKPTGNIAIGAGYSSSEKLTLTGSIQQANVFGSGNTLGLDVNTSSRNRTISLSQTNPYFTEDGVSRSYEVFTRTTRPPEVNSGDFKIETKGGNIRFGVPFSEVDTVFFGIGVERTTVETFPNSPLLYQQYVRDFGDGVDATTTSFPLTAAWQRDSRDSALVPSTGRYQRANLEVSTAGSLRYYRAIYQHQYFKPMFSRTTLALNGEFDYGKGFGGKPYPVFKNFYAGGIGSVRGYEGSSLSVNPVPGQDAVGGQARLILNAELQFPFPGTGSDRSLRWFTFFDAGNVFNLEQSERINTSNLRYSAGVGISWISPIGPLKLSFGKALNAKEGDRTQSFQFQLGTGF